MEEENAFRFHEALEANKRVETVEEGEVKAEAPAPVAETKEAKAEETKEEVKETGEKEGDGEETK